VKRSVSSKQLNEQFWAYVAKFEACDCPICPAGVNIINIWLWRKDFGKKALSYKSTRVKC